MMKSDLRAKKFLIFDFDRTIDELLLDWPVWVDEMVKIINSYVEKDVVVDHSFFTNQNLLIEEFGQEINQKFIELGKNFERDAPSSHRPDEAVVNFIRENDSQNISIWTSNHSETIKPILENLSISEKIKIIVGRESVPFIKPRAEGFAQLFISGSKKEEYLMIGDSSHDEGAAKNAGIDFIHVDDFKKLIS